MDYIENRTFDEIKVGDSARLVRTLTKDDINIFAAMSGDVNPAHMDEEYARSDLFHKIIAHGMWGGSLISTLLGTKLPGPGAIYLGQTLTFLRPVGLGDRITVAVTATAKDPEKHRVTFDCQCSNEKGEVVISGTAEVLAPTEKVKRPRAVLPEVHVYDPCLRYRQLIDLTKGLEPIRMAVVHPVDRNSLQGAIDAAQLNLMIPVLVGPEAKIRAAAEADGIDLSPYELIPTTHSHEAAARAVALARAGEVETLMKGSLHTDELMHEVVAQDTGLRTARRISHVFVMDVPAYPAPPVPHRRRHQHLTRAGGQARYRPERDRPGPGAGDRNPKVAILSAVETVTPKICGPRSRRRPCARWPTAARSPGACSTARWPSTTRSREEAAHDKGIVSRGGRPGRHPGRSRPGGRQHAGQAAGRTWPTRDAAGIVLGARVPIVLTSRADKSAEPAGVLRDRPAVGHARQGQEHRGMTQKGAILVLNAGSSSVKFSRVRRRRRRSAPAVPRRIRRDRHRPPFLRQRRRTARSSPTNGIRGRVATQEDAVRRIFAWLDAPRGGTGDRGGRPPRGAWRAGLRRAGGGRRADARSPGRLRAARPIRTSPTTSPPSARWPGPARAAPGGLLRHGVPPDRAPGGRCVRAAPRILRRGRAPVRLPRAVVRVRQPRPAGARPRRRGGAGGDRPPGQRRAAWRPSGAGKSLGDTMGFTALDGLPMGTRCGQIDPGVLIYLMQQRGMIARPDGGPALQPLRPEGPLRRLQRHARPAGQRPTGRPARGRLLRLPHRPRTRRARRGPEGGLDALVFTAGIGEHAAEIRARVCRDAAWLGVALDDEANRRGGPRISPEGRSPSAWVIPTDEELMIARHTSGSSGGRCPAPGRTGDARR